MSELFNDVITFAIGQEIEAAELYEKYAKVVKDRGAQKMLEEMAQMERGHEQKLKKFLETGQEILAKFGEIAELYISDYLVEKELTEESSIQDVYIFAMKAEEKAYVLYTRLAALEADTEKLMLFADLAEEEKKHKYNLEQEYENEVLREN